MYRGMTVAAAVPAYNEEGYVGNVIDDIPDIVDRAYVVDDGSTDDTWAEIEEYAEAKNAEHEGHFDELVVPIQHEENRGVGGAIKTGYLRAYEEGIDATVVLGGDDQMNPETLPKYLDPIAEGRAGYTKGDRFMRPEDWVHMPSVRLVGNVTLSLLTKIASGYWGSMDSQNGYAAISYDALERTDIEGMYEYYGYCNNLLVRLNVADVRVADVRRKTEYAYQDGWHSHIDYKGYVPKVSLMLLRSFLWRLRRKYLVTDYDPLAPLYGLGMTAGGVGVLGFVKSLLDRDGDGDAATWFLVTVLGAMSFLYATVRDVEDNEDLVVKFDPEVEAEAAAEEAERSEAIHFPEDGRSTPAGEAEARSNGDGDAQRRVENETVTDGGQGDERAATEDGDR